MGGGGLQVELEPLDLREVSEVLPPLLLPLELHRAATPLETVAGRSLVSPPSGEKTTRASSLL